MTALIDQDLLPRLDLPASATGRQPGCHSGSLATPGSGAEIASHSPIDGSLLARCGTAGEAEVRRGIAAASEAFLEWRTVPAPRRGELVRRVGELARHRQEDLAQLLTAEAGKILAESRGEVQELIDICDFAVGLSRQLHGLTISSERPQHRMMEQWHPLGPVAVITAFNFPMAVWAWNAMIALVCGDTVLWKPSEKTPLCALACQRLVVDAARDLEGIPDALSSVLIGGRDTARLLVEDPGLPLVSATGSVSMGRDVAQRVGARLGRSLLELGGNNAAIVMPSADLDLTLRACLFAAVGTAGQRCTSLRRLIVHEDLADRVAAGLADAYRSIPVGDPRSPGTLCGPLIDQDAVAAFEEGLRKAQAQGGKVLVGGHRLVEDVPEGGCYVQPALVSIDPGAAIVQQETFGPILYLHRFRDWEEAIAIHNGVPQGLSSAIFTESIREAELFLAAAGSDCGIANVNIGTSGAEIGGAFGGEKDTGGGRESGSDAWKAYMRRTTNTVNYGQTLPLAQGVRFELA